MSKLMDKMGVKANRAWLQTKKHAPEISFGFGVVTLVGAIVYAGRQGMKAHEVLERHRSELAEIKEAAEQDQEYAVTYQKQDKLGAYSRTTVGMVKTWAPVVALGGLSLGCFAYSNHVLKGRYLVAVSAYNAVSGAFETYRSRVREEEGVDADRHYMFGTERQVIESAEVDENGKKKKVKKEVEVLPAIDANYEYTRIFDQSNYKWDPDIGLNILFLKAQQEIFNNLLDTRGHVFLNEVLHELGFDHTEIGAYAGWVKGNGDNYITFGIERFEKPEVRRFLNGEDNIIPLEFNVDGFIADKI